MDYNPFEIAVELLDHLSDDELEDLYLMLRDRLEPPDPELPLEFQERLQPYLIEPPPPADVRDYRAGRDWPTPESEMTD